jgi:cytoskeleton protein RodZ
MASVAEQLRTAREAQNLTVHQVADITKIRTDHLRALEEGNFDVFMAPVYIKGFVRSYATLLKLDVKQVMANLEGELRKTEKFAEPPRLSQQPRGIVDFLTLQLSKLNWRVASIVLAVLAVLALIYVANAIWKQQRTSDPLKGAPPALYKPSGKQSGETLPLTNPPTRSGR